MKTAFAFLFCLPLFCFGQRFTQAEIARYEVQAKKVSITIDNWGIAHIYGKTDADAVFGLMYIQCEQNFSRLERNYLEVFGRLAEIEGESQVFKDLQMQLIYDSTAAKNDLARSPEWLKKLLHAFADGINYYLYKHPEVKPLVLQKYEPWFPLMYTDGSISATQMGGITENDTKNLYASGIMVSTSATASPLQLTEPQETGSNGFAVAPSRTASKNALLYINPHVTFYFRTEAHMVSEEGLNVYGAATWGNFFIYQGFNEHCGWMHTSSYADVADLYAEKTVKQGESFYYEYNRELKPVLSKQLVIRYKKNNDVLQLPVTAFYTHHGPVMGSREGVWLSLKERNRSLEALEQSWLRTKAKSFAEFKKIMDLRSNNSNNTVYADNQKNIAYWHGNFVPRRSTHYNWSQAVDGSIRTTEWTGVHLVNETVHLVNPATGWIQNCNSTPFTSSGTSSPKKQNYPPYMAPEGENGRAVNAARLLSTAKELTLDKIIRIGYDRYLSAFEILLPPLFKAYDNIPVTDSLQQKLELPVRLLRQWDRYASATSVATTLAIEWGIKMMQQAPPAKDDFEATNLVGTHNWLAKNLDERKILQLLHETINELNALYKTWYIAWGDINRYQRNAKSTNDGFDDTRWSLPVALGPAVFGSLPAYTSSRLNTTKRYGTRGNSFIAAVEFGKKVKAKTIMTGGESFDPSSKHFTDQAEGFINGKFKEVNFYKEDVMKHAVRTFRPGE